MNRTLRTTKSALRCQFDDDMVNLCQELIQVSVIGYGNRRRGRQGWGIREGFASELFEAATVVDPASPTIQCVIQISCCGDMDAGKRGIVLQPSKLIV